jgi:hypothetical protein
MPRDAFLELANTRDIDYPKIETFAIKWLLEKTNVQLVKGQTIKKTHCTVIAEGGQVLLPYVLTKSSFKSTLDKATSAARSTFPEIFGHE